MTQPLLICTAKCLMALVFLTSCGAKELSSPTDSERPNIVLIMADDLGYRELGSYGQELIKTPHLDDLAAKGMRFTEFYSGSTVCAPSRCTLLTGMHTGHSYVRDNYELGDFSDENEGGQLPLPAGTYTLASMLKEAGYTTGAIGKWGLGGPGSSGVPNQQGFDYFYGYLCQKQAHNYYPTHLWENQTWDSLDNDYFLPHQSFEGDPNQKLAFQKYQGKEYAQEAMTEKTLEFIENNRDRPFFLYLPFTIPHLALQVPDEALQMYQGKFPETPYLGDKSYLPHHSPRAAYAAMITYMDQQIGLMLAKLESYGLTENTVVLFTSDNGTTFDIGGVDRKFFQSLGNLRGHKTQLYEGGIKVPLIVKWPGRISPGSTSNHLAANWDILPTVAEIIGTQLPHQVDGISFLPSLLNNNDQTVHRYLYWEFHGRWNGAQAVRWKHWKGVRLNVGAEDQGKIELYDLSQDPGESVDLSDQYPQEVEKIRAIMQSRTKSHIEEWNFNGKDL